MEQEKFADSGKQNRKISNFQGILPRVSGINFEGLLIGEARGLGPGGPAQIDNSPPPLQREFLFVTGMKKSKAKAKAVRRRRPQPCIVTLPCEECEWTTPQRFSSGRDDPAACAHRRGA
jgi:hypothetical protein